MSLVSGSEEAAPALFCAFYERKENHANSQNEQNGIRPCQQTFINHVFTDPVFNDDAGIL